MDLNQLLTHLLCPPGEGVFTVSSARDKKNALHQKLYGTTTEVKAAWEKKLKEKNLELPFLLAIPSDSGGGIHRGANWGPLILRELLDNASYSKIFDLGDIRVNPHLLSDELLNIETIKKVRNSFYQNENIALPVAPLSIADLVCGEIWKNNPSAKLLTLGGDHSISYPVTKNWLLSRKNKKTAIIHFDAHTDLLNERLGIDICFGSWTNHLIPYLHSPSDLLQIGIRASGKDKKHWETNFGITQWWAKDIKQLGMTHYCEELKKFLSKYDEVYITFDYDCIDAEFAATTGTPESAGLLPHEAVLLLDTIHINSKVTSADFVEFAPFIAFDEITPRRNSYKTAKIIFERLIEILQK